MLLPLDWVLWLRVGLSLPCGATVAPCGHATGPACQADEVADSQMGAGLLQVTGDLEEGQAANRPWPKPARPCLSFQVQHACEFLWGISIIQQSPLLAQLLPTGTALFVCFLGRAVTVVTLSCPCSNNLLVVVALHGSL